VSAFGELVSKVRRKAAGGTAYPMGLHMGSDRLHLVQMQSTADGSGPPAIRAAAAVDYEWPLEETLADKRKLKSLLARAWRQQPFSGSRVIASMPKDQVKILLLSYTAVEGQSESEAIVRELRERIKGTDEDIVVDYMRLRAAEARGQQRDAIVAMAERNEITRYLDALSGAGLEVEAVDIGPSALTRVVAWIAPAGVEHPPNLLLVNFGATSSYLTVVWGRRLMLDRGIDFAERRLLERLQAALDMSPDLARQLLAHHGFSAAHPSPEARDIATTLKEVLRSEFAALTEEVNKTLVYTASKTRGRTVDKIFLVGAMAHYPGIRELLQELLVMPVELLDPFSIFPHDLASDALHALLPHSAAAVATGLALRNVKETWPTST
jgi:type IV pilus assembly protein PilM